MIRWAIYEPSGRIDRIYGGTADEAALQAGPGEKITPISALLTDAEAYVVNSAVQLKQPFPLTVNKAQIIADAVDTATISGVPAGTTVTWHDGQVDEVTDGVVELATDLPDTYTLKFSAVAYLDQEVTLEAVAAP